MQLAAWPVHKKTCGKLEENPSAPKADTFEEFGEFIKTVADLVSAVLQLPLFDNLYGPIRVPILFHLHYRSNLSSRSDQIHRRFDLVSAKQCDPSAILDHVSTFPGGSAVVPQYRGMFDNLAAADERKYGSLSAAQRLEVGATMRIVHTAEVDPTRFIGLRVATLNTKTRTRSGLDPRNRGLPFEQALVNLSSEYEPADIEDDNARQLRLLQAIVKEFSKNDAWLQRAHDSRPAEGDTWDDRSLVARAIQLGVDEKIMLGGRASRAYLYAVPAPEERTRCECGEYHGVEGHVEEDEDESQDEGEMDSHGGHSHSHDGRPCSGHGH